MLPPKDAELESRWAALRAGFWLGWLSIASVLTAVGLGLQVRHRTLVLVLVVGAVLGNAVVMVVPWRGWLGAARGRLLLDLWTVALIGFVGLLVMVGGTGANFDLLFFLVFPFIATAHKGQRRGLWLLVGACVFVLATTFASAPLQPSAILSRSVLLVAAVVLALSLARVIEREDAALAEATARSDLEHLLLAEAHHRVKNSLQTVADLLLLGRPDNDDARAFDETATRIRSIAAVHRLIAETGTDAVTAGELIQAITEGAEADIQIETDPIILDAATAQQLGIIINELVSNAIEHGQPPIAVRLQRNGALQLSVEDAGDGTDGRTPGLGLKLVRQVTEQGLAGTLSFSTPTGGGTYAVVTFPQTDAHPHR